MSREPFFGSLGREPFFGSPGREPFFGSLGEKSFSFFNHLSPLFQPQGLPTSAIQYGAWEVGMAADPAVAAKLAAAGMGVLRPVDGLAGLARADANGGGVFAAAVLDAGRIVTKPRARWPFYAAVEKPVQAVEKPLPTATTATVSPTPTQSLLDYATSLASTAASRAAGRTLSPHDPLLSSGVDSLGAVALRRELSDATGLDLPATLAFDYPTVAELGRAVSGLLEEKRKKEDGGKVVVAATAAAPTAITRPPSPPPDTAPSFTLTPAATVAGFYTYPSAAALSRAPSSTLTSLPRFTIGRNAIGEIAWLRPVDVRGLDVQTAVSLERGRVAVNATSHPTLNSPALVTFFNMAPPAGGDAAAFEARLRRATERAGWGWVGWEGGEWCVRVGRWW